MQEIKKLKSLYHFQEILFLYSTVLNIEKVTKINELEKEYLFIKKVNTANFFNRNRGDDNLFKYIDQNKLLELYPDYEFIYGPYIDSNSEIKEPILVFHVNTDILVKIKTIYFKRAIEEIKLGYKLSNNLDISMYTNIEDIFYKQAIVNARAIRVEYNQYIFSEEEKNIFFMLYPECTKLFNSHYNQEHGSIKCTIYGKNNFNSSVLLSRLLYEIYIVKRRLTKDEEIRHKNNKRTDVRLENLELYSQIVFNHNVKSNVLEKYNLNVDKLLKIYSSLGFTKFINVDLSISVNRMSVTLLNPNTRKHHEILLSRALMTVKMNRLLDPDTEYVDHINRNKRDDRIENLRIVNKEQNVKDDSIKIRIYPIKCSICNNTFIPAYHQLQSIKQHKYGMFCTIKCASKVRHLFNKKIIPFTRTDIKYEYYLSEKIVDNVVVLPEIVLKAKSLSEAREELKYISGLKNYTI